MIKRWIDLDALNWLPENPVYFYPLLCKQFTSIININNALNWLPENPVYYYLNNLPVQ
jgi:hypothetical protein